MPANRFGAVNTQPIYNVTGRNPRDMERGPTAQPFQAPAAGVSKDFSADQRQQPQRGFIGQLLGDAYWNPLNPLNRAVRPGYGGSRWGRRGRRGGGGGDGDGADRVESEGGNDGASPTINIHFGDQSGHRAYENAGAVQGVSIAGNNEGDITGGSPFSTNNQTLGGAPGTAPSTAPGKPPSTRKPRTAEQKAARNQRERSQRAAQRQAGTAPKPRKPRTPKQAATPAQNPPVQNTTSMNFPVNQSGDIKNVQGVNFP